MAKKPLFSFEVKGDKATAKMLHDIGDRAKNVRPAWRLLQAYMMQEIGMMFRTMGSGQSGGKGRGTMWEGFANQYVRKTDGVVVPAWGGVQKVYGEGFVLGRKRPSGKRITKSSRLMQDTGKLTQAVAAKATISNRQMVLKTTTAYTEEQDRLRRFMYWWLPKDLNRAVDIFETHLMDPK